ncbi:uncharacterized protein AB675_5105 [Cyphellophora attinorum]|uniref:F-box domain-containing protein n=1 Tax=Cyphellophora attinorum TaxID=1664694 RepID=A0A0N0NLM1_9EURO|nr:uncharacterized protein AB675_5105 [Phialophora attinorum]KPI39338.1 hypothetical protein AB675_5105 [Phialophora attinorum]
MAQADESDAQPEPDSRPKAVNSAITEHSSPALSPQVDTKAADMAALAARDGPLKLLDLPEDILQSILKEVTHTNDLTALALTHSTLHNLVIPHIYSRFDIVWPEVNSNVETRVGVDALTYGLATLVMANDVFGEPSHPHREPDKAKRDPRRIRRGNHFGQYTKKFSLGNGPAEWVSEYLITKEGGKMLGTLVALAIGRMRNLETFIWDMPTGVLRDVWLALASLGTRSDGEGSRLEKVWVRWHENTEGSPLASPPPPAGPGQQQPPNIPAILAGTASALFQVPPYPRVEFPTFSILPPLRSLTVLDIDEVSYIEEMSVLIENSLHVLRELRVGVAEHAQHESWTMPAEERRVMPPQLMLDGHNPRHRGGILGILVHRFAEPAPATMAEDEPPAEATASNVSLLDLQLPANQGSKSAVEDADQADVDEIGRSLAEQHLDDSTIVETPSIHVSKRKNRRTDTFASISSSKTQGDSEKDAIPPKKMQLDSLDLERVFLSVSALSRGIDWTRLTSITLLGCRNHEQFWKELRRKFAPASRPRSSSSVSRTLSTSLGGVLTPRNTTPSSNIPREEYRLKITRLHTDTVSQALIAFIKDGLAPDSLEWLFLQDSGLSRSTVSVDTIYKGAIRRHRNSLRKLLIDSDSRKEEERGTSWRKWVLNREILGCLTSGRIKLRELSLSIDYKDWHYFLQRLPQLKTLRALHIAHTSNFAQREPVSRETALQVSDIVSLRPELELCYLGVHNSCYEVLECPAQRGASPQRLMVVNPSPELDSDDNDDTIEEADDASQLDLEFSHGEETEDEGVSSEKVTFRLREILFYEDKVSIFRARHGRL